MFTKRLSFILLALLAVATYATADKAIYVNCGKYVTISATPKTGYHFVKWDDGKTAATRTVLVDGPETYQAIFAIDKFLVKFVNHNDTVLQKDSVEYGVKPSYTAATATKTSSEKYDYTFSHWNPTIVNCTAEAIYKAEFDSTLRKFTVKFVNYNGDLIQSSSLEYGSTPTPPATTPTRPEGLYKYTFKAWAPTIGIVTKDTTYTAQYDSTTNYYTLTLSKIGEGTVTGGGQVGYGQTAEIKARPATCYQFKSWNDGNTDSVRTVTVTSDVTYTATFEIQQFNIKVESNNDAWGEASASDEPPVPANLQAIDLGLSVKWANMNIGADSVEGYGSCFAWGETASKTDYTSATYVWMSASKYTKYCIDASSGTVDWKNVLEATDDAATANWGKTWRMPTYNEIKELVDDCTWNWVEQKGVVGYKVKGPNGKSIFLPTGGIKDGTSTTNPSAGYYWSSSLYYSTYSTAARCLKAGVPKSIDSYARTYGCAVRAVCP